MSPERKPILCYVTDSQALEVAAPSGKSQDFTMLLTSIRRAACAGVDWIQIREKHFEPRALAELVRLAMESTRGTPAKIFVNDRLDVAIAAGAAGVQLGENSLPVQTVAEWRRSSGRTEFRIGVSCHSIEAARAAEKGSADFVFFGPVFATPSKASFGHPQGLEGLREACNAVRIPVLAIGGVNVEKAATCLAAGAAGVAAIRIFQAMDESAAQLRSLTFPRD